MEIIADLRVGGGTEKKKALKTKEKSPEWIVFISREKKRESDAEQTWR